MARLAAILNALGKAVRRDLGTFGRLRVNNFFLFILLLIAGAASSGVEPVSAYPPLQFLFFVLLFPLSADPLDKVPPSRLALWPLSRSQRIALRLMSLALSPVLWLALLLLRLKHVRPTIALTFLITAVIVQAIATLGRRLIARAPRASLLRLIPRFPGKLGGLIQHDLRQMLTVLDVYLAVGLSLGACAYLYLSAHPDPAAPAILSLLITLAMSTYAQCLFGLDLASSATTRYRLLPLRGWQILAAKDAAFLLVLCLLILPVWLLPGLTFGFAALAVGHHASVWRPMGMRRWRFAGSRFFLSVFQMVAGVALGFQASQRGVIFLLIAIATYAISLVFYGWLLDHRPAHSSARQAAGQV